MKTAALVTSVVAAVLFAAMAFAQWHLELGAFRLGSKWSLSGETLEKNIKSDQSKARSVVVPLLFPLDFFFLIFFGVSLALWSITYADALVVPSHAWILLILPLAYMVADLGENLLYSRMLLRPDSIERLIDAGNWATRVKFLVGGLAILQASGAWILSERH